MTIYENLDLIDELLRKESEKENVNTQRIKELVESKAILLGKQAEFEKEDNSLKSETIANTAKEKAEKKTFWVEVARIGLEAITFTATLLSKRDLFNRVEKFEESGKWTSSGAKEMIKRDIN